MSIHDGCADLPRQAGRAKTGCVRGIHAGFVSVRRQRPVAMHQADEAIHHQARTGLGLVANEHVREMERLIQALPGGRVFMAIDVDEPLGLARRQPQRHQVAQALLMWSRDADQIEQIPVERSKEFNLLWTLQLVEQIGHAPRHRRGA